jgi:mannose-6-phosphate isomerase-like protein (cupin superfamily)
MPASGRTGTAMNEELPDSRTPGTSRRAGSVVPLASLPQTEHAHEFVGADHGPVPFSLILVHATPGAGPALHSHPYAEVFVVESGEATFQLGDDQIVVTQGHIVVGPPNVPHGFTNTGTDELRLTAIHGAAEFATDWLSAVDRVWASTPDETA